MTNLIWGSTVLVVSVALVACKGDEGGQGGGGDGGTGSALSAVQGCAGDFLCTNAVDTVPTRLERRDGICYAGQFRLDSDGKATSETTKGEWHDTADGFSLCISGDCIDCRPSSGVDGGTSQSPPPSAEQHECGGVASSCYGRSTITCSSQDGCYTSGSGSSERCEGSPRSCFGFFTEASCMHQDGCYWR